MKIDVTHVTVNYLLLYHWLNIFERKKKSCQLRIFCIVILPDKKEGSKHLLEGANFLKDSHFWSSKTIVLVLFVLRGLYSAEAKFKH